MVSNKENVKSKQPLELFLRQYVTPKINFSIQEFSANLLRKKKLIEGRKPNYHISRQIAKITHSEAQYTKMKGLDDNYYKSLILSALEQHGPQKFGFFKELFFDKLPDLLTDEQKASRVKNLLAALRRTGKVKSTKGKLWTLSDEFG